MENQNPSSRKRNENREDLIGEHAFGDLGQLLLLILFSVVWITDSFIFHYSDFISEYIPFYIRLLLCIIILILSGYLALTGLNIVFGEIREAPIIIRKGVFNIVRHPIYLSAILLYFGLLLFSTSICAIIVWLVIITFYHFISRHEEKLLMEKFGNDYKNYMADVPMWIPKIKR